MQAVVNSTAPFIGKLMTWTEAVARFPNQWVAFSDYKMKDCFHMDSGILKAVLSDADICRFEDDHIDEGLFIDRTTNNFSKSFIHVSVIQKASRE